MEVITNVYETPVGTIIHHIMPLANKEKACVMLDDDGVPNVYTDPKYDMEKEFNHEFDHIRFNDMDNAKPITMVEKYLG